MINCLALGITTFKLQYPPGKRQNAKDMVEVVGQIELRHVFLDGFRNRDEQCLIFRQDVLITPGKCSLESPECDLLTKGGGGGGHGRVRSRKVAVFGFSGEFMLLLHTDRWHCQVFVFFFYPCGDSLASGVDKSLCLIIPCTISRPAV